MIKTIFTLTLLVFSLVASAIVPQPISLITSHINKVIAKEGFVPEFIINDEVPSSGDVINYYGQQAYKGIPVYNTEFNISLRSSEVVNFKHKFIVNIANLIASEDFELNALEALAKYTGTVSNTIASVSKDASNTFIIRDGSISNEDIHISRIWVLHGKMIVPAYSLAFLELEGKHWYDARISASSGKLLSRNDWMTECHLEDLGSVPSHTSKTLAYSPRIEQVQLSNKKTATASYNVFAYPIESPNHGNRSVVVSPENTDASPFGWHDTDGSAGEEFTITRGNNVYASEDIADADVPGSSPDGGSTLTFDASFDVTQSAANFTDAAIINLFYWNNIMHDVWWHYGFDEISGNFQSNNYGNGGGEDDHVLADAQDGSGTNNANFGTPPDGQNPRMQMFLWNSSPAGDYFAVNSPASVAGKKTSNRAQFGPQLTTIPLTGNLVLVDDGSANSEQGCNTLINSTQLNGNIALILRRGCNFTVKVKNAQTAGAIAVVIYDDAAGNPSLMGGTDGTVSIPSVMITNSDGVELLNLLSTQVVNVSLYDSSNVGTATFDSDFDNGVIAHEYGHGISNRLTGGPAASGCLSNKEQMGEGWSDFFSLVMTHQSGDSANQLRGIGTYVKNEPITGRGIRPYPYSADITRSPYSYDDIKTFSVPHGVGSVWCSMLWDLYWAMIDKYGYDSDIYDGTGGNNKVMQLVIDGLKLQSCNPGFEDGRDAILLADKLNNNGEDELLIWQVFARRGLGFGADQGSSNDRGDGSEDFEIPPYLKNNLVFEKLAVSESLNTENLSYSIKAYNRTSNTIHNIVIRDTLSGDVSLVSSSLACGATFTSGIISISLDSLAALDSFSCTFNVVPSLTTTTALISEDDVEGAESEWTAIEVLGTNGWGVSSLKANSGDKSWFVSNQIVSTDYTLERRFDLAGLSNPVFSFSHFYNSEETWDGGVVEIKIESGDWQDAGELFIENGYNSAIQINQTSAISGRNAFTGNSGTFNQSKMSLQDFAGETISIRFRFASDGAAGIEGWYIDDMTLSDAVVITNSATVNYGDEKVATSTVSTFITGAPVAGVSTYNLLDNISVYPNPAQNYVTIDNQSTHMYAYQLRTLDGRVLAEKGELKGRLRVNLADVATGLYLLTVTENNTRRTFKVMIQ
jgi:hypothetical protein